MNDKKKVEESSTTKRYSWIHNQIKSDTLTLPTTQPTMKIINHSDKPQHHSPTDSNDTSTASCTLQIDKENVTKELILYPSYSRDII